MPSSATACLLRRTNAEWGGRGERAMPLPRCVHSTPASLCTPHRCAFSAVCEKEKKKKCLRPDACAVNTMQFVRVPHCCYMNCVPRAACLLIRPIQMTCVLSGTVVQRLSSLILGRDVICTRVITCKDPLTQGVLVTSRVNTNTVTFCTFHILTCRQLHTHKRLPPNKPVQWGIV
jgi:hypothetical protein